MNTRQSTVLSTPKEMPIGLRHITEDLIALIEGRALDPEREQFVISEWSTLLSKARLGAQLAQNPSSIVQVGNQGNFERIGIFCSLRDIWRERAETLIEFLAEKTSFYEQTLQQRKPASFSFESEEKRVWVRDALHELIGRNWTCQIEF